MTNRLKPILGTLHLWRIAVGLVISGEYFGWSYGWAGSDSFGMPAFSGIFAAIPFAIWFFLAIEGTAMAAEKEKVRPAPFRELTSAAS